MGRRTGKEPTADDSFLMRICHALDESPRELAKNIGVSYTKDLAPLLTGYAAMLVEMDRDQVWFKIDEYVSKRVGLMLAIKYEMNKALQTQRTQRATRMKRLRDYHDKR